LNKYEKLLNSDRRDLTAVPPSKYGLGYRSWNKVQP